MNVYKISKIDFCIGFKKLNLKRNKYITDHVHYAILERDWESILEKCNISTNANNISARKFKRILIKFCNGETLNKVADGVEFSNRSVKTALKRAQINSTYLGKHCQQKCKVCGKKLKNEHVILISVYQFIHALATRHDSKKTSNNRKILSKWDPFLEFFIKKFKYFMKYKNSKDLNEKAVEESVQNIIFQFKQEMKKENKLDTVYIPSVSAFYRFLKKHKEISNKLDIFPYLSRGKGQKKQNVIKRDVKKKSIGELITERPESVNQRLNDNDYELDTVIGTTSDKCCILTLINRKTRMFYFTIVRRSALAVKQALISMIDKYHLTIDTLTIDNGSENYRLSEINCIKAIYHCHPYSSSEKGSIENCHRLLRRYFPKGKSLDKYAGQDTSKVMEYINSYARKIYSKNCVSNALLM